MLLRCGAVSLSGPRAPSSADERRPLDTLIPFTPRPPSIDHYSLPLFFFRNDSVGPAFIPLCSPLKDTADLWVIMGPWSLPRVLGLLRLPFPSLSLELYNVPTLATYPRRQADLPSNPQYDYCRAMSFLPQFSSPVNPILPTYSGIFTPPFCELS